MVGSAARKYLLSQQALSGMTIFWQHPAEVNACAVALFGRRCRGSRHCSTSAQLGSARYQIAYGGTLSFSRFKGCFLSCYCFLRGRATRRRGGFPSWLTKIHRADGRVEELIEGIEQALRKGIKVANGVPVGSETEEDFTVIRRNSNCKHVARRERKDRVARH